jgi:tRNA-2-methylthio-N6-dimethylallyladenosine synthase
MSGTRRSNRFFVETWGCQMNELDSQRMNGQLMQQGLLPTHDPAEADVILLNSCSVREKAEQKVYSRLGEYRRFKRHRPHLVIGLCGCVAQQEGERALQRVPELDFVLGPARVGELTDVVHRRQAGERLVATGFPDKRTYDMDAVSRDSSHKGMVTIIEGCDKKCTFCIVPATRGPERCRSMANILYEVRHLVEYGFVEIELLGQTVNHWREPGGREDFADLLDRVAEIPGVKRLRFVTSYPRDFTTRMVQRFAEHPNICPYLHLPVQSGADRVLQRMGRGYTIGEYDDLVESLRRARPDLALSTDIIVGFPGETEAEFEATLELIRRTRFSSIFAFVYSPRPGTAAPKLRDRIPKDVADERLQRLLSEQQEIQRRLNEHLVGETFDVLVTGPGREPASWTGRTPCHRVVHFPENGTGLAMGDLASVRIERALPHSLLGAPAT